MQIKLITKKSRALAYIRNKLYLCRLNINLPSFAAKTANKL